MNSPQPIPYQGSKRGLAARILTYFPKNLQHLYEPFAGSAAITIAAALNQSAQFYYINDINQPLMSLWNEIINYPDEIANDYEKLWNSQIGKEKEFYKEVRKEFNISHQPSHFLYLLARGVKGAIRYNTLGAYNQSPDNRRLGKNPRTMRKEIYQVSNLLKGKTKITSLDYRQSAVDATPNDLLYLDPPYQGVCTNKDSRYFSGISYDDLIKFLDELNSKRIPFILSYDGKTGNKVHGKDLPPELKTTKIELDAGRSSTSTLQGKTDITIESLYISKGLFSEYENHIHRESKPKNSLQLPLLRI